MPNSGRSRQMELAAYAVERVMHRLSVRLCGPDAAAETAQNISPSNRAHKVDLAVPHGAVMARTVTVFVPSANGGPGDFINVTNNEAARRLDARQGVWAPRRYASQAAGWPWCVPGKG